MAACSRTVLIDQFPDCEAAKRDALAQFADARGGRLHTRLIERCVRKMDRFLEQGRGIGFKSAAMRGGLAGEFRLKARA